MREREAGSSRAISHLRRAPRAGFWLIGPPTSWEWWQLERPWKPSVGDGRSPLAPRTSRSQADGSGREKQTSFLRHCFRGLSGFGSSVILQLLHSIQLRLGNQDGAVLPLVQNTVFVYRGKVWHCGDRVHGGSSVLSAQVGCDPKTALKDKPHQFKTKHCLTLRTTKKYI